jgi:hypothetical protein
MKLFASRPLDIADAEAISIRHRDPLDWRCIEEELVPWRN